MQADKVAKQNGRGGWGGGIMFFICKDGRCIWELGGGTQALHLHLHFFFSLTLYFSVCMHKNLFCISHSSKRTKTTNTFSPLVSPPLLTIFLYTLVFYPCSSSISSCPFIHLSKLLSSSSVKVTHLTLLFLFYSVAAKP